MKLRGKTILRLAALATVILLVAGAAMWRSAVFSQASSGTCVLAQPNLGRFVDIPGGGFVQGADAEYAEEGPPRKVFVSPFRLQAHEVTNSQFAAFVEATGYVTEAEKNGGSAQFRDSGTPEVFMSWWSLDTSVTWRSPQGAGTTLKGLDLHPVVHVTLNDARAYAHWAGGRIPTEVEWEYAASLGLFDPDDPFSGVAGPDGEPRANVWSGLFPVFDSGLDGFAGIAPVGCFAGSRIGAYDMIGNVWEWTDTPFAPTAPRFTIKGGSYLCSKDYCQRYRAAAREDLEVDFSTAHVGFRIVKALK